MDTYQPRKISGTDLKDYFFLYEVIYLVEEADDGFGVCGWILIVLSYFLVVITFPVAVFFCLNVSFDILMT